MSRYDIFISYRRDGGEQSAKAIYDALRERGYNVFLDIETLRSGAFNTKLYSVIEECSDMIVVLSPQALERCANEEDWVRLEIAHALRNGKNVVPVMLRGFEFPGSLPEDINAIRFQNGIQASVEFFDAFIGKLCTFIQCKPRLIKHFKFNIGIRNLLIGTASLLILAAAFFAAVNLFGHSKDIYPATREEKNEVNRLLSYIEENMTVVDLILSETSQALDACEDYLVNASQGTYSTLYTRLDKAIENIDVFSSKQTVASESLLADLGDSSIMSGDAEAYSNYPGIFAQASKNTIQSLMFDMDPNTPLDHATRNRIIELNRQLVNLEAEGVLVRTCMLLKPVDDTALAPFRTDYLSNLASFSESLSLWSKDAIALESKETNIESQEQKLMDDYAALVGNMNRDFLAAKEDLVDLYRGLGYTEEEARKEVDNYIGTLEGIDNAKAQTDQLIKELDALKQTIREQCAPVESDTPDRVWSKAEMLLSVKMYDDAVNALQYYLTQVKETDEAALAYVPAAIRFIRQIGTTGLDYGALVWGYDPEKPHDLYRIGDIIVAFNGSPCRSASDYVTFRKQVPEGSDFKVTVLRPDDSGVLKLTDLTIPSDQPKIYVMDLTIPQE